MARIELRFVGVRPLHCTSAFSTSRLRNGRCSSGTHEREQVLTGATPPINVNTTWNGDHAGDIVITPQSLDEVQEFDARELRMASKPSPTRAPAGNTDQYSDLAARLVMLPMYMPSVTKTPHSPGSSKSHGDYSDRGADDSGGHSHCLRVALTTCSRITSSGSIYDPLTEVHTTTVQETCFFEHDLLRETWTELLVPFTASNQNESQELDLENTSHGRRRTYSQLRREGQAKAVSDFAVVLQARAAGMGSTLSQPPLWLIRRDFAERTVGRIIRTAAAAVAQPRVEVTMLGLRGAIDSLLLRENTLQEEGRTRAPPFSSRYAKRYIERENGEEEGGSDTDLEGLSCETYWNGSLVHNLRLVRQEFVRPENASRTGPPQRKARNTPALAVHGGYGSLGRGQLADRTVDGCPCVDAVYGGGSGENERETAGLVDMDRLGRPSDDNDPSTWFLSGNPEGNSPRRGGEEWMILDGASSAQISTDGRLTATAGSEGDVEATTGLDDAHQGKEKYERSSLEWVPGEGETYGDQPFRFFLPACLSDTGTGSGAGQSSRSTDGGGDEWTLDRMIRSDLRIMLWATPSGGKTNISN